MQTCLDLLAKISLSPETFLWSCENKLHGFFFFLNREIGYKHPTHVWIYGLVIPLWSNLAGTSAA